MVKCFAKLEISLLARKCFFKKKVKQASQAVDVRGCGSNRAWVLSPLEFWGYEPWTGVRGSSDG